MVFFVKVRNNHVDWEVFYDIEAGSFGDAERQARMKFLAKHGGRVSDTDAKAYRADSKSVWRRLKTQMGGGKTTEGK